MNDTLLSALAAPCAAGEDPATTGCTKVADALTAFFQISPDFAIVGIIPAGLVAAFLAIVVMFGFGIVINGVFLYVKAVKKHLSEDAPKKLIAIGAGLMVFGFAWPIGVKIFEFADKLT